MPTQKSLTTTETKNCDPVTPRKKKRGNPKNLPCSLDAYHIITLGLSVTKQRSKQRFQHVEAS
jgi:hypothetical protein